MIGKMNIQIREAANTELDEVLSVERAAFKSDEEADLVRALLSDPSARPVLSLLAWAQGAEPSDRPVGHILFTTAQLTHTSAQASAPQPSVSVALLAPLAVIPDAQKQGVGTQLVVNGLERLSQSGVDLVFVLGHPEYYPRHGFQPAGVLGFEASYPIPAKYADAWMVKALRPNLLGRSAGKVICADALMKPELWIEE